MSTIPSLQTDRIELRPLHVSDAEALFPIHADSEVNRYLVRIPPNSVEDTRQFIQRIVNAYHTGQWYYWAVVHKEQQKLIGTAAVFRIADDMSHGELGFELATQFHGQGLMQEIIPAIIQFSKETLPLDYLIAHSDPDNQASIHLLEKFGFKQIDEVEGKHEASGEEYVSKVFRLNL